MPSLRLGVRGRSSIMKRFDAVEFQRKARERMSREDLADKAAFKRKLRKYEHA
jgi:hypothetical protein